MNVSPSARATLFAAGILGLTGVALGALSAHALAETLAARGTAHAWDTAARYQMYHAVALFVLALWLRGADASNSAQTKWLGRTKRFWLLGTVLFAGSLYALALGGPRWIGPITPVGGVVLLLGWLCLIAAATAMKNE